MPVEELRRKTVKVDMRTVAEWRQQAGRVREATDATSSFALFADIEDAFEPIEESAAELVGEIDREVQRQIDVARGK